MFGLPVLGPAVLCDLFAAATAMACIAILVASATALAIVSLATTCTLAIFNFIFYVFLNETLLLTPSNESCLYDDKTYWCF